MPTLTSSGTQTAIISTEHTIVDTTSNKWYSAYIDLTNMASGDTTEIRAYVKVNSSSTAHQWWMSSYSGAQTNTVVYVAPMPSDLEYKLTIKQTAGTGRNYDFRIYEA